MEKLVRERQRRSTTIDAFARLPGLPTAYAADTQYAGGVSPARTAAQNTAALNAAIAAANRIVLPKGRILYNALSTITGNDKVLVGEGMFSGGTELASANASGDCITFGLGSHCGLENLYLSADVRRTNNFAVRMTSGAFAPRLKDVRIDYHFGGVHAEWLAEATIDNLRMRYMLGTRGLLMRGNSAAQGVYGCSAQRFNADNPYPVNGDGPRKVWTVGTAYSAGDIIAANGAIYQCSVGGTSAASGTGPIGMPGTSVTDVFAATVVDGSCQWRWVCHGDLIWSIQDSWAYSCSIDNGALLNGVIGFTMRDTLNTGSSRPKWFNTQNLEIDHAYSTCVLLSRGEGFYCGQGWFGSSMTSHGLALDSTWSGEASIADGTSIRGNWGHGMIVDGPNVTIGSGTVVGLNSQQGIGLYAGIYAGPNSRDLLVSGVTAGRTASGNGRQSHGFFADAAADRYTVIGNNFSGNHVAGISAATSASKIVDHNLV